MVAGVLVAILLIAALAVGGFAVSRFSGGTTHAPCVANCSPKFVTPLQEEASFRSTAYKFTVNYPSAWTVRSSDANGVLLGTKLGSVQVVGTSVTNPQQAIQAAVASLPTTRWQGVTLVTTLKGAHLGDQDGVGAIYAANLLGASQTATKVRFAVIAAAKGNVTVVVLAIDPADPKGAPNGMPEGQDFDYLCTEFAWT